MFFCLACQDLGSSDLRKDVYIVVHIIRIGAVSLFYWALHVFLNLQGFHSSTFLTVDPFFACLCVCVQGGWEQGRRRTCAVYSTGGRLVVLSSALLISSLLTLRTTTCSRFMRKLLQTTDISLLSSSFYLSNHDRLKGKVQHFAFWQEMVKGKTTCTSASLNRMINMLDLFTRMSHCALKVVLAKR